MIPPSLLALRINRFVLWLPLFLLWPLLLIAAPFVLLACLFTRAPFRAFVEGYRLMCALRGLTVHVNQPGQRVHIRFI